MLITATLRNYRCFPDDHPAVFSFADDLTALVGVNNSGKSSLLRFFYEFRELFAYTQGNLLTVARGGEVGFGRSRSVADDEEPFSQLTRRDLVVDLAFAFSDYPPADVPPDHVVNRLTATIPYGRYSARITLHTASGPIPHDGNFQFHQDTWLILHDKRVGYTPLLLSALRELQNTMYIPAFRNAINAGGNDDYYDMRVGERFIRAWGGYKAGSAKRNIDAAVRLTDDIKHIFNFGHLEINTSSDGTTLAIIADRHNYRLNELGAGFTQFVVVLAEAAMRNPSYILIDEPELNLHPSLQLDFLTTLASYSQRGVIFATHSLGLARTAAQRVFAVRPVRHGISDVRALSDVQKMSEFVAPMSFGGHLELGFSKILLVEGPTEVLAIQQLLRMLKKDHKVLLLPLGGGSLIRGDRDTELTELRRISGEMYSLIDSERSSSEEPLASDRQGFRDSCAKLGIKCHVLERRAFENYLPDRAVKAVKGEKYRGLGNYERLTSIAPAWGKHENWRIARATDWHDIKATDLGQFLVSI